MIGWSENQKPLIRYVRKIPFKPLPPYPIKRAVDDGHLEAILGSGVP